MAAEPRISALVLARDEAANLPGCLASLAWVDEIVVVVDAASRDATLEIAERDADAVVVRPFDDFASQRNAALQRATGDWVLSVDADERATAALAAEVRALIAALEDASAPAGYRVPIRSVILGRPFGFSGTQDDRPLRLFRRGAGRWIGAVHETVALRGPVGTLRAALQHRTIPDMQTFLRKLDHYTTLEALKLERENIPYRASELAVRPLWTFLKLYLAKQGFRDGLEGLVFCAMSGVSVGVRQWKYRERLRLRLPDGVSETLGAGGAVP
jgi:glycosyltransferase involved in cell wall biosynthesis